MARTSTSVRSAPLKPSTVDFDPLADLSEALHRDAFSGANVEPTDPAKLSELLNAIFAQNLAILSRVAPHHSEEPADAEFDYHPPELTRYGRLVNDVSGAPRVEIAFGLLHYERALGEFDQLKRASRESRKEATLAAGVYCIVSIAACLEAVSNKLFFLEKGRHPIFNDRGTPLEKLNASAVVVAAARGRNFVPLDSSDDRYQAMDRVRKLRNIFMHASERDEAVSADTLLAEVFDEVSEVQCRLYLRQLRLTIGHVFDQLPDIQPPIVTSEKVTWMRDIEVP